MIYVDSDEALEFSHLPHKMKGTIKLIFTASMGIIYELENAISVQ